MYTIFHFSDGKLCKKSPKENHDQKSIAWNRRLLSEWREIHEKDAHVHCAILSSGRYQLRLLFLGRTREEALEKCGKWKSYNEA